jgi:hypothetical protein
MIDHLGISRLAHRFDDELPRTLSGGFASSSEFVGVTLSDHPENFDRRVTQANVVGLNDANEKGVNQSVLLTRLGR